MPNVNPYPSSQPSNKSPTLPYRHLLFFFIYPPPPQLPPLSLHDALPISWPFPRISKPSVCRASRLTSRRRDRKSTRLNSSHVETSYAVFCLKKKKGVELIMIAGESDARVGIHH